MLLANPLNLVRAGAAGALASLITQYQRRISPRKGFSCAYRVCRARCSCSQHAKRLLARVGVRRAWPLMLRRLRRCRAAADEWRTRAARPGAGGTGAAVVGAGGAVVGAGAAATEDNDWLSSPPPDAAPPGAGDPAAGPAGRRRGRSSSTASPGWLDLCDLGATGCQAAALVADCASTVEGGAGACECLGGAASCL